jgi:Fe-S cluster assembly protein SufD
MSIATSLPAGFGTESFEAFLDARREPDWLTRLRRNAWADFEQMGWPDRRDEEWIRTDIRLFKLGRFSLPSQKPTGTVPKGALAEGVELAGATASLNGFAAGTTADAAVTARGVVFGELDELFTSLPLGPTWKIGCWMGGKIDSPLSTPHVGRPAICYTCREVSESPRRST